MKNGVCSKCNSTTVHQVDASRHGHHGIPISMWRSAVLMHYICVTCGYAEGYVTDAGDLARIAEEHPQAKPA